MAGGGKVEPLDDNQRDIVREHPRSEKWREAVQRRAKSRMKEQSGKFDTPTYKLNYTSDAKDAAGNRWRRYAVSGEPFDRQCQLLIRVRWRLKVQGSGYIETSGASSSWVYTRRNYKYMLDEAFSSALKKTRVSYGMISGWKIIDERLMVWTRKEIH